MERASGGGVPSLGTVEDMLRKSPDTDISLSIYIYRGPFITEGNMVSGGAVSCTGDFERWMKGGFRNGASLWEGFHEGDLEEGLLY